MSPQRQTDSDTFERLACRKLRQLWRGVFDDDCPPAAERRMLRMLTPWGATPIPQRPAWPSDIGDDHSPFEFSLALDRKGADIRFLVEAQGSTPTLAGQRDAAVALTYALRDDGADLTRFERVKDLFLPADIGVGRFALWHATRLSSTPEEKVYFNPEVHGVAGSRPLVEEAMTRLGLRDAWRSFDVAPTDRMRYFALDLSDEARARVKVYFYRSGIDPTVLAAMARGVPDYRPEAALEFCRAVTGSAGPWNRIPICFYLSFVEGEPVPIDITFQIPIRFFASDDAKARDRVCAYLQSRGVAPAPYERALAAIAHRPLDQGSGLQSYVSLRPIGSEPRVVVYLSVEAYATAPRRDPATLSWDFTDPRRPPKLVEDGRVPGE